MLKNQFCAVSSGFLSNIVDGLTHLRDRRKIVKMSCLGCRLCVQPTEFVFVTSMSWFRKELMITWAVAWDYDVILQPCVVVSSLVHVYGVFMRDMFGCVHAFSFVLLHWWCDWVVCGDVVDLCHGGMRCIVLNWTNGVQVRKWNSGVVRHDLRTIGLWDIEVRVLVED